MHDVFLSYSSHDKPSADAVCHGLESHGIRCFIAPRDLTPAPWPGQLTQAIRSSKVFVLIFSENSNTSDAVESEVNVAVQCRVHIVNFRIDAVDPSPDLELHLRKRHWLDAIKPVQKSHIDQLAGAIEKLIRPEIMPPPATDGPEAKAATLGELSAPITSADPSHPATDATPPNPASRWAALMVGVALIAGAVGWSLRKHDERQVTPEVAPEPSSITPVETAVPAPAGSIPAPAPAPAKPASALASTWKVQVLNQAGDPIESGNPVLARRQKGTAPWTDAQGGVHEAENSVRFTLQMKSAGSALSGPFMVHYFLKEEGAGGRLRVDDTIAPGLPAVTDSYWKDRGYTRQAAWRVLDQAGAPPLPAAGSQDQPFSFNPSLLFGKEGYLAHGIHEIGIEVEDAGKNVVYRGALNLEVWETDPRDNLLEWVQMGDATGLPAKRIKSYPSTDAAGKTTHPEADLEFPFQIKNVSGKSLGKIGITTWFIAQPPTAEPKSDAIVATARLVLDIKDAVPPTGYTSVNYWSLGNLTLEPGIETPEWSHYLGLGRGGWIPAGLHELGIELWADGAMACRHFQQVQVPAGPAKPGLELLDAEGRPIPPNSVVNAKISQEYKSLPNSGNHFEVALFIDVRYQSSGIGPNHQSAHRADGYGDLVWLLFLPEVLRPHPATRHSAAPFQLGDFDGPDALWAQGNVWGTLEPGDPAPIQSLTLAFPLDPSIAQPREGRTGHWVQEGDHRVRLLAVMRDQPLDRYPDPEAVLFQRDFTLRVSQPEAITLGTSPEILRRGLLRDSRDN
ncbi:MAG: toll/interleukin-1 receptor domain-containing protein [Verrucomicrobiales bacterium]|nr:toll/interleukin-1 receptor domain-containing protein [Verrucomicrobiales bacterium]